MRKFLLLALICYSVNVYSQIQRLNPYFGKNGIAKVTAGEKLNTLSETIFKIFPLNDGKTIIVLDVNNYAIISRRLADGTVDKTYGDSGYSHPVKIMQPIAAAMQDDNKILVTGQSDFSNTDFILARFSTNGTIDKS